MHRSGTDDVDFQRAATATLQTAFPEKAAIPIAPPLAWVKTRPAPNAIPITGYAQAFEAGPDDLATHDLAKYLNDATELDAAIADPANAHPRVVGFAHMLEQVRHISNRSLQIEIVNAYVNMLGWDSEQTTLLSTLEYRSLKSALEENLAMCDASARLKLYALLNIGFKPADVCWLAEVPYQKGEAQEIGHAVLLVRNDDENWILNINQQQYAQGAISLEDAEKMVLNASRIENDVAHMNFSGNSFFGSDNLRYIPSFAFSPGMAANYDVYKLQKDYGNLPKIVRTKFVKQSGLTLDELDRYSVMRIVAPVLSVNYKIQEPRRPFEAAEGDAMPHPASYAAQAAEAHPLFA